MFEMSFAVVLKNVFSFAQIISQSSTEVVSHWDAKSLKNAFNWAAYCEKVYENVKDKPFRNNLEQHLQEMTSLLSPPSCFTLNVESLGKATEILEEKLLVNQNLKLELFEKLFHQCSDKGDHLQKFHRLSSLNNILKTCSDILQQYRPNHTDTPEIPPQSRMLYQHFKQQLQIVRKTERYHSYINSILTRLAESGSMELIVCIIAVIEESNNKSGEEKKVLGIILAWLEALARDTPTTLLSVNKRILCEVAVGNIEFLNLYLQCLVTWGQTFTPDYHKKYFPKLYIWRNPENESYQSLLDHFLFLSSSQPYLKQIVTDGLDSLIQSQYFCIWLDIKNSLKQRD